MMARRKLIVRSMAALGAFGTWGLSGCASGLLSGPPPALAAFTLDDGPTAAAPRSAPSTAAADVTLLVETPRSAPGHDTQLMAYQRHPQQLEYFANHQWIAAPAQMLTPMIVRALQDAGTFRAVTQAPTSAISQWRLETSSLRLVQDFEKGAPSRVQLSLRAVLVETSTRRVLATRDFAVQANAGSESPLGGAMAARTAARELLQQLRDFCAQAAAR